MGRVPDANRPRVLVAAQPGRFPFDHAPLAADAIHDLDLLGASRHSPQQPFVPGLRGVVKAGIEQRGERERGVAQPAVAIVPVARAAEQLGQRRRRRRHDSAGRPIGQRLEGDQRAHHRFGPGPGGAAPRRPVAPEGLAGFERRLRHERRRDRQVRGRIGQQKRDHFPGRDREMADRVHVLAREMHRRVQHDHVGPGDGAQRAVLHAGDPGNDRAEAEAQHELEMHRDAAAFADHQAHQGRVLVALRHEVDERDHALVGLEAGLENKGVGLVAPGDARPGVARGDQPASVLRGPEQRRKAGLGVESRPAQPVDRTVLADQRGRPAVTDERIIFDAGGHG